MLSITSVRTVTFPQVDTYAPSPLDPFMACYLLLLFYLIVIILLILPVVSDVKDFYF